MTFMALQTLNRVVELSPFADSCEEGTAYVPSPLQQCRHSVIRGATLQGHSTPSSNASIASPAEPHSKGSAHIASSAEPHSKGSAHIASSAEPHSKGSAHIASSAEPHSKGRANVASSMVPHHTVIHFFLFFFFFIYRIVLFALNQSKATFAELGEYCQNMLSESF